MTKECLLQRVLDHLRSTRGEWTTGNLGNEYGMLRRKVTGQCPIESFRGLPKSELGDRGWSLEEGPIVDASDALPRERELRTKLLVAAGLADTNA